MSTLSRKLSTQRQPLAKQSAAREAAAKRPAVPLTEVDRDLARLEASLQWIQREGRVAARMPRAAQLRPVSGLRPVSPQHLRSRDEQFINGARVPPPLAPERLLPRERLLPPERLVPPPMRERRDNLRGPAVLLLASVIAAPIAYYFSVGSFSSNTESGRGSGLTSLTSRLIPSTEFARPKEELALSGAEDHNTMVSSRNQLAVASTPATKVVPARIEPPAPEPAAIPPSPGAEQSAPAPKPDVEVAKVTADTGDAIERPDVKTTADRLKESKAVQPPDQHRTPTPRPRPSVNLSLREGDVPVFAKAVTCQISGPAGDGHWAWRLIDGRKCWYKGAARMDKSLLHWPSLEYVPELQ